MINVTDCKDYVKNKLLEIRNLHTLVISERFTYLYNCVSEVDRLRLIHAIKNLNHRDLTRLIQELEHIDLELLSVKDLRRMAQNLGVRNYNTITKDSMIQAIKRYEKSRISQSVSPNGKAFDTLPIKEKTNQHVEGSANDVGSNQNN